MILILSGTGVISGAEYVLKDFLVNTSHADKFHLLSSDIKKVKVFYNELPIQKPIYSKSLNPVGAKSGSLFLKTSKFLKYLKSSFTILNLIRKTKSEIVLGNNSGDIIYSMWVKVFSNKRFYLYVHDIIKTDPQLRKLFSCFGKYVDRFIVVSEATKESLTSCGISPEKVHLVYNGLSVNSDTTVNRWSKKSISLGFVGALIPRKDPMLFVKIIHELSNKCIPVEGTLVYNHVDKKCEEEVTNYISTNNLPIKMLGALKRTEMKEYYKKLHFLIVSSKRDPFPTVILESFNNSTPVIGISNDGIPEMITENYNGILFNTDSDIEKIINFIEQMSESDYQELSLNAQTTIRNKFSIELKVKKLEEILELN